MEVTSTELLSKVSKMDTTIKKIGNRVVQHEQETQRRLDLQHGMKDIEDLSNCLPGVEDELEIIRGDEEKLKIWVKDFANDKLKELSNSLIMPSSPLFTPSSPLELRFQALVGQIDKVQKVVTTKHSEERIERQAQETIQAQRTNMEQKIQHQIEAQHGQKQKTQHQIAELNASISEMRGEITNVQLKGNCFSSGLMGAPPSSKCI